MIIMDVEVPMLGKRYDFQVDETVSVDVLREEMMEMICRKEQCSVKGDPGRMLLWDARTGRMLSREASAEENGLVTGSKIVLV